MRRALPAGVIVALFALAPARAAASDSELLLTLAPLYSSIRWDSRQPSGGGLMAEVAYGLNEAIWLRGTAFYTAHAADGDPAKGLTSGVLNVAGAFLGLTYAFDVLRIIPFVDGGLGGLYSVGAGQKDKMDFGVEVGIGADYLVRRTFSVGVVVRYYAFVTNIRNIPVYLYAGPRISWRWD
jgi:hypothetical protein